MFLTKSEVADMLGYSVSRLNTLLLQNNIPIHRLSGGNGRILKHDIVACMMHSKPYEELTQRQREYVCEVVDGF